MPAGLEITLPTGVLVLDENSNIFRCLGVRTLTGTSGSFVDANLTYGRFAFFIATSGAWNRLIGFTASASGTTVNWSAPVNNPSIALRLTYGVY